MTQYVCQIEDATQRLLKSYIVTLEHPIREHVPEGRTQCVITNTEQYDGAVEAYKQYGENAHFSWDGVDLTWTIEPTNG